MPAVTRVGDTNTGHDLCPPVSLASGSSNVFVDKIAVGRVGDSYSAHGCIIHLPHSGAIASGSSTVFVNGIPVGRIGDSVSCGGSVAQGSSTTFADDGNAECKNRHQAAFTKMKVVNSLPNVDYQDKVTAKKIKEQQSEQGSSGSSSGTPDKGNSSLGLIMPTVDIVVDNQKCTLPVSSVDEFKTIVTLPEIARHISKAKVPLAEDKQGWYYLALMFEKWLCNDGFDFEQHRHKVIENGKERYEQDDDCYDDPFFIKWDWLDKYDDVKEKTDELIKKATNEAGKKELARMLANQLKDDPNLTEFNFINDNNNRHVDSNNFASVNDKGVTSNLYPNGLFAAMGSFTLKSLPAGTIDKIDDNRYKVTVNQLAVYAEDSFQFADNEYLGYWSANLLDFLIGPLDLFNYVKLNNSDFRDFRKTYNKGKDFVVLSDNHVIQDYEPVSFEFTVDDDYEVTKIN
jgi:uncharacterized Zn-binding protein involved in type VI secretion